jgi:hypothetical protein
VTGDDEEKVGGTEEKGHGRKISVFFIGDDPRDPVRSGRPGREEAPVRPEKFPFSSTLEFSPSISILSSLCFPSPSSFA